MDLFEQMTRMLGQVPNPHHWIMNRASFNWCSQMAQERYHITLQPGEEVQVQRFAGIPIEVDPTVPPNTVYLIGGQQ